MYKMYLISAEGYENAKVDFLPKTGKFGNFVNQVKMILIQKIIKMFMSEMML